MCGEGGAFHIQIPTELKGETFVSRLQHGQVSSDLCVPSEPFGSISVLREEGLLLYPCLRARRGWKGEEGWAECAHKH